MLYLLRNTYQIMFLRDCLPFILFCSRSVTFAVSEWLLFYISTLHFLKRRLIFLTLLNCILFKNTF